MRAQANLLKFCCLIILAGFWSCAERSNPFDPGSQNFEPLLALDSLPDTVRVADTVYNTVHDTETVYTATDTIVFDSLPDGSELPVLSNVPFYLNLALVPPEASAMAGDTLTVQMEVIDLLGQFVHQFVPFIKISFSGDDTYKYQLVSVSEKTSFYEIRLRILDSESGKRATVNVELNFNQTTLAASLAFTVGSKRAVPSTARVSTPYSSYQETGDTLIFDLRFLDDNGKLAVVDTLNTIKITKLVKDGKIWEMEHLDVSRSETGPANYQVKVTNFSNSSPGSGFYWLEGSVATSSVSNSTVKWSAVFSGATGAQRGTAPVNPGTLNLSL